MTTCPKDLSYPQILQVQFQTSNAFPYCHWVGPPSVGSCCPLQPILCQCTYDFTSAKHKSAGQSWTGLHSASQHHSSHRGKCLTDHLSLCPALDSAVQTILYTVYHCVDRSIRLYISVYYIFANCSNNQIKAKLHCIGC